MTRFEDATRREFLTRGVGVLAAGTTITNLIAQSTLVPHDADAPILVVLQMSGGHDGLSAVVPFRNDDYIRNRKSTLIKPDEVLKVNDDFGLHPKLTGFKNLLDAGSLAVIQGVGYPKPVRSHFKSMDVWHMANNSPKAISRGWIGRYCDHAFKDDMDPKLNLAIGGGKSPRAIRGKAHPGIAFAQPNSFRYRAQGGDEMLTETYKLLNRKTAAGKMGSKSLQLVAATTAAANASSDEILRLAARNRSGTTYPRTTLASALQTVAALIAGGLSTRVYYVTMGGFDTHRTQRRRHDRLMTEFDQSVSAFQKDLAKQGNAGRVVTMAFSEFGRRVKENASQGTDHGKAGPMFLVGPGVNAGIHGALPSLAKEDLDKGDLVSNTDFRSVYATVLEKWLRTESQPILGARFPLLDCLG